VGLVTKPTLKQSVAGVVAMLIAFFLLQALFIIIFAEGGDIPPIPIWLEALIVPVAYHSGQVWMMRRQRLRRMSDRNSH